MRTLHEREHLPPRQYTGGGLSRGEVRDLREAARALAADGWPDLAGALRPVLD